MKDNNIFDAPEPRFKQDEDTCLYIPDSDQFEDIGVPLTSGTSFSVNTQLTGGATNISVDGSKIYITGLITGQTARAVRRYTLTGTYESAGNLTVPGDTRPSGIPSSWIATQGTRFFRYSNNWYRSLQWTGFSPTIQNRYVFDRHNSSLAYQQTLWMLPIDQLINLYGFDIYNNRVYIQAAVFDDQGTGSNVLQIRNLSNGALISGTNSIPLDFNVSGVNGSVSVTPTRIYVSSGNNVIQAYNHMGSRVSGDDTTLPSGTTILDMDASGETLYILGRTGARGSYSYSVTPYTQPPPYSVTWGTPTYNTGTRAITAVLTLSEDPGTTFSASADFEVEVRSGSVGSYTWSTSSNWTLSATGTGTTRTITATPANTVSANTYRILLKEDAFGSDKPNCDVTTDGQAIAAYVPPYSASWATPTYTTSTRAITAVLTLSEDPGSGFSTTADFEVEARSGSVGSYSWATSSGWTFASTGTGTTRTITATPSGTVADGTYRLVVKEDAFGTNKPDSDIVTTGQAIIYSATWGMPSYDSVTRAISSTLTLTQDPGATFSVTADFNVERRSGSVGSYTWASSSGWTLSSTGTGLSRTITATPANTVLAGTYRISLNEDAFGTDKPDSDVTTSEQTVGAYVLRYSASWGSPTYLASTRSIRSVLTLSEDPGSTISVRDDFKVQFRSGSPGSYSWSDSGVDSSDWSISSTGSGTTRTITARPSNDVIGGTYRLVLLEDSFGTDKPNADVNSDGQAISDFYTATWGSVTYTSSTRAITAMITLSEDPGSGFSVMNDFEVEVRSGIVGSYTWSRSSDWTLSATGSGTTRTITATPGNLVLANTYRLVLKVNAFGTNKPRLAINSDGQAISNYESPYSAMWGMPSYTTNTRAISVILTLSEDPGSAFSASSDFRVQVRSGSPGSYSWSNSSGWSLSSTGTGITRTITATPSNSVIAGTYRLVLNRNAFGSGKPSTDTTASEQAVAAYVAPHSLDGQDQFYFDFNIPQDEIGTLQIFVKGSSFYVSGESDLTNLADGQYLGSIGFDTRTAMPTTDRSWAFWDNLEGGTTLKGRLHFIGDAITALANTDIEVLLHGTGNRDTNFNITVSSSAVSAGQYVEVEATPLSTYYADGTFRFRLKSDSVMVGTQTAPSENVDSNPISLNTLLVWGPVSHGSSKGYIESTLTFNSDYIDIGTADFSILDQTDEVLDEWTITITPSVTTRSTGTTLVVRGTPSPSRPVYDSFRLQLNRSSIRFSNRQANHAPTNNLISNPILVATAEAPEPAANVPYLVVEAIPAGTQTGTEVVIDLEAQLNGVAADIDGLRPEDFVITSPEGNITPTLATR